MMCLALGSLSGLHRRSHKIALRFFTIAAGLYFIFASGPVSHWLLGQLEYRYPAFYSVKNIDDVDTIVVLTGYVFPDPIYPLSSRVNGSTLFRLSETLTIWNERPFAKVVLAGPEDMTSVMRDLLVAMGIPNFAIIKAPASHNTLKNIQSLSHFIDNKRFILVTSAGHMHRAVILAKKLNLDPIPAPTDYYTSKNPLKSDWLPTPTHLEYSDLAVHEYLALAYYHFIPLS